MSLIAQTIRTDQRRGISIRSSCGLNLYSREWVPSAAPRALIFWFHGYGAHCHRASDNRIGEQLLARDIALFAIDQRGCGCSEGKRGLLQDSNTLTDDAHRFIDAIQRRHPTTPFFIMGESLGGALAIALGINLQRQSENHFGGAMLIAPAIQNTVEPNPLATRILLQLARIFPFWYQGVPYPSADKVYRTSKAINESKNDTWPKGLAWNRGFRLATAATALDLITTAQECIPKILFPLAVVHGSEDLIVPPSATGRLIRNCSTPLQNKASLFVQGGYHDLLNDPSHHIAESFLWSWLESQITTPRNQTTKAIQ